MLTVRDADFLLAYLCVTLGLCLSPKAQRQILACIPESPGAFVAFVLSAEQLTHSAVSPAIEAQALAMTEKVFARASS